MHEASKNTCYAAEFQKKLSLGVTKRKISTLMDRKSIGTDVNLLEKLVQKTGLSNVVLGGVAVDVNSQVDSSNSDETDGENVDFQLIPEDFSKKIENGSKAIVTLRVLDDNGNRHEVQGEVYVDLYWGNQYKLNLSGNAKDGYFLGH